ISIKQNALVYSPFTVGFLKPVIVFPVGLVNQLSIQETEAILVHEMAHILRKDYLINLMVSVIKACMYYHPVVWWLDKVIQNEREYACDQMAINLTGQPIQYAKLLISLQEKSLSIPCAMHMAGDYSFT